MAAYKRKILVAEKRNILVAEKRNIFAADMRNISAAEKRNILDEKICPCLQFFSSAHSACVKINF